MQQPLTESQRTGQPSLLTCCQLLEEPWDSSLGSPLSVEWRLSTLELRSSLNYSELEITKTNEEHVKEMEDFHLNFRLLTLGVFTYLYQPYLWHLSLESFSVY